jgi:hypothetical protein
VPTKSNASRRRRTASSITVLQHLEKQARQLIELHQVDGVLALGLGATAYFALNRMLARPRRRGNEAAADDDGGCWGRAPLSNTVPGGACASGLINEPSRSPRLAPRRDQARICPGILVIIGLVLFDAVAGTSPTGLDPILRLGRWLLRFPGVLPLVLVVVVLLITQPLFFMTLVLATLAVVIVLLLAAPEGQRIQVFRPRDGSLIALVGQVAERDPHYAYTIVGFEAGHEAPMTPAPRLPSRRCAAASHQGLMLSLVRMASQRRTRQR